MKIRSSKLKRKPLTRAEIQAAYRRRAAVQQRELTKMLVFVAYLYGRRSMEQGWPQDKPAGVMRAARLALPLTQHGDVVFA